MSAAAAAAAAGSRPTVSAASPSGFRRLTLRSLMVAMSTAERLAGDDGAICKLGQRAEDTVPAASLEPAGRWNARVPFVTVVLPDGVHRAMGAHARFCFPEEWCDLLAADEEGRIRMACWLSNAERSTVTFILDSDEHFRARWSGE